LKDKLPLSKALFWIGLTVLVFSGSALFGWLYYLHLKDKRASNDQYLIKAIIQTGPHQEALKTVYLAEILGLSVDMPTNLFQLNTKKAEQQLMLSPVIKQAKVTRMPPSTLYIDYAVRQPIMMLYDYHNAAIDSEGYLFPIRPFFTPKRLPELYLGLPAEEYQWNIPLKTPTVELALTLHALLSAPPYQSTFRLLRIDVAHAFAESYGRREIILIIEDQFQTETNGRKTHYHFPRILRMSPDHYQNELKNYLKLREPLATKAVKKYPPQDIENNTMKAPGLIIDLRIPPLAFMKE
jgi:hypothetical protein